MSLCSRIVLVLLFTPLLAWSAGANYKLQRGVIQKTSYDSLPGYLNTAEIVVKFREDIERPALEGLSFLSSDPRWKALNEIIGKVAPVKSIRTYFTSDTKALRHLGQLAEARLGESMPDLSAYFHLTIDSNAAANSRLALLDSINRLDIVEIAYFPAQPVLAGTVEIATPNFQSRQIYLNPAPEGVDAYYGWQFYGGKGEDIKVIDIEGNWVEHHEDLRGGASSFHIAGWKIPDPEWYHHGTAVLGEIASDSNVFGTTGIAYNVDLGTVSIGTMSIADAITIAAANSDTGDIILIELQIGGPNGGNYVPVEYEQATFDAILLASASGRIVVEAGANGGQNLDDTYIYGQLFNPAYRFSGAILVGAADLYHDPEGFSSYGQRVDVHAYGEQVATLGYGDLYGTDTLNYYTASFSGTSSASPIITGSCAVIQGIHKNLYHKVIDHNEMRGLLQLNATPQISPYRHIGPMPNLKAAADDVIGVRFDADTNFGWVPFPVSFNGNSGLVVDKWLWSFGDGDSSLDQNPVHLYDSAGVYDVQLQVTAGADVRTRSKVNCVIALADSLIASDTGVGPGDTAEIIISATNSIPLRKITIPISFSPEVDASVVGFSTSGCRTDYFEMQKLIGWDTAEVAYQLRSSNLGTSPDLPPGSGPILKVRFAIPESATGNDTLFISLAGYSAFQPEFLGPLASYSARAITGSVTICQRRGDVNQSGGTNVVDVVYLVNYLFRGGPAPTPMSNGDVNCAPSVNILDVVYLVKYLFSSGPPPCSDC